MIRRSEQRSGGGLARGAAVKLIVVVSCVLILLAGTGCLQRSDFDQKLAFIVRPYGFNQIDWEFGTIFGDFLQLFRERPPTGQEARDKVEEYFLLGKKINILRARAEAGLDGSADAEINQLLEQQAALSDTVEQTLQRQLRQTIENAGIYSPGYGLLRLKVNFPPVYFKLEEPPNLLVISPKDRIELTKSVLLKSDMSLATMAEIEAEVNQLNVSSLVTGLGGLAATYPSIVTNESDLRFAVETVAHEWVHEYLAFTPLGFSYVLDLTGISSDSDIATMNETAADILGKDIGALLMQEYYPGQDGSGQEPPEQFDFDAAMREIRKNVDHYLAQGQIEAAERYMEESRLYLASKGYYIRKINQAFFAFNSQYGDSPGFINQIGLDLRQLRDNSPSLSSFLEAVSGMTSRKDLDDKLGELSKSR